MECLCCCKTHNIFTSIKHPYKNLPLCKTYFHDFDGVRKRIFCDFEWSQGHKNLMCFDDSVCSLITKMFFLQVRPFMIRWCSTCALPSGEVVYWQAASSWEETNTSWSCPCVASWQGWLTLWSGRLIYQFLHCFLTLWGDIHIKLAQNRAFLTPPPPC